MLIKILVASSKCLIYIRVVLYKEIRNTRNFNKTYFHVSEFRTYTCIMYILVWVWVLGRKMINKYMERWGPPLHIRSLQLTVSKARCIVYSALLAHSLDYLLQHHRAISSHRFISDRPDEWQPIIISNILIISGMRFRLVMARKLESQLYLSWWINQTIVYLES